MARLLLFPMSFCSETRPLLGILCKFCPSGERPMAETISYVYLKGPWQPEDIQLLNERGRYHHHLAYIRPYQEEFSGLSQPGYILSFRYAARTDVATDPILGAFGLFSRYDRDTFMDVIGGLASPGVAPIPTGGRGTGGAPPADPKPEGVSGLTTDGETISASASSQPTFFQVQAGNTPGLDDIVANFYDTTEDTSHSVKVLLPNGWSYRARFTSKVDGGGTPGDWTAIQTLMLPSRPTSIVYTEATNMLEVNALADPVFLHAQSSPNADFSGTPTDYYGTTASERSLSMTLTSGDYIRARFTSALNGGGLAGPWSTVIRFVQTPQAPSSLTFS